MSSNVYMRIALGGFSRCPIGVVGCTRHADLMGFPKQHPTEWLGEVPFSRQCALWEIVRRRRHLQRIRHSLDTDKDPVAFKILAH